MYATPDDVGVHLGRPLDPSEHDRLMLWIGWLEADIDRRLPAPAVVDPVTAQRAIVESIATYMDNPTAASQVSIQVDDGGVTKSYKKSAGRVQILPEFWADLGWSDQETGASSITPYFGVLDAWG